MRKFLFISAVLITAMTALTSCDKTKPAKYSKEQVTGEWHFLSGELPDISTITPETVYHADVTLKESGTGALSVWYEADQESITKKTAEIKWTLADDRLSISFNGKELSYEISIGEDGNLTTTSEGKKTEYRKDQFVNLKDRLVYNTWYSPDASKFREKISYSFYFESEKYLTSIEYNKEKKLYSKRKDYYELRNNTITVFFSESSRKLLHDWTVLFLNEKYMGLGNMILQN